MKHLILTILFFCITNTASAGFASIISKALTHSADEAAEVGIRGSKRFADDVQTPKTEYRLVSDSQVSKQTLDNAWMDITSRELSINHITGPSRSLYNQTVNSPDLPRFVRWWGVRYVDDVTRHLNEFQESLSKQNESTEDPRPISNDQSFNPDPLFNPIIKETLALEDNSEYATNLADVFDVILLGGRYMGLDPYDTLASEKLVDLEPSDYLYLDTSLMGMLKSRGQEPEKFEGHLNKSSDIFFTSEYAEILRPFGCFALLNTSAMTKWYVHNGSEEIFKKHCDYESTMDNASRLVKLTTADMQMDFSNSEEMQQFFGIKSMQVVAPIIYRDEEAYYEFRNRLLSEMQNLDIEKDRDITLTITSLLSSAEIRFGNYRNAYDLARLVFMESLKSGDNEFISSAVFLMGESLLKSKDFAGAFEMAKILEKLSNRNSEYFIPAENKIYLASYLVALETLWSESI